MLTGTKLQLMDAKFTFQEHCLEHIRLLQLQTKPQIQRIKHELQRN